MDNSANSRHITNFLCEQHQLWILDSVPVLVMKVIEVWTSTGNA